MLQYLTYSEEIGDIRDCGTCVLTDYHLNPLYKIRVHDAAAAAKFVFEHII
jgi:hypothetical protein